MFLYSAVSRPLGRSKLLILARVYENTSHDVVLLFLLLPLLPMPTVQDSVSLPHYRTLEVRPGRIS